MAYNNAAQKGSGFLLAKGATNLAAFKTKSLSINSDVVDVTTIDDTNRYRQLLAAAAIKHMTLSGSGIIKDTAANQALFTDVLAQTVDTYTVTIPGVGTFAGSWTISQLSAAGEYAGEMTFDITLESAGDITFTAEG